MAVRRSSSLASLKAGVAVGLVVALGSAPARADGVAAQCIDAHEQAQRSMQDGHLRAAREKLLVCSRETCPKVAQTDCSAWMRDVARDMPSVVVTAKDAAGHDTEKVRVVVDGETFAESLDGRAFPLDPGPHAFRFESEGRVLEQKVLVGAGEQNRHVVADFASSTSGTPVGPPPPSTPDASPSPPVATYVLGGVAVLGLASFTVFGLSGKSTEKCVPSCTKDEVSDFRRSYLVADISLGIALVSLGAAAWFALTKR
jgi:hypothetical protein